MSFTLMWSGAIAARYAEVLYTANLIFSAREWVMPFTASISSKDASRKFLREPKCRSNAFLRFGPTPETTSKGDVTAAALRRFRW